MIDPNQIWGDYKAHVIDYDNRLRLLENIMITITITRFINVIDYDYDYIVK